MFNTTLASAGNYDVALALGELYGFQGYLFYFLYMAIAFLLLMNMLLAILVDAYINVKVSFASHHPVGEPNLTCRL